MTRSKFLLEFKHRSYYVGFVVDKAALRQIFSKRTLSHPTPKRTTNFTDTKKKSSYYTTKTEMNL
jgi:hypothetical protein